MADEADNLQQSFELVEENPSSSRKTDDGNNKDDTSSIEPTSTEVSSKDISIDIRSSSNSQNEQPSLIRNAHYKRKEGEKTIGDYLKLTPIQIWFWIIVLAIPTAFLVLMFGVIPQGNPYSEELSDLWVLTFILTPITMTVIAYLNVAAFLSCMGVDRPFRAHVSILIFVYLAEIVVINLSVPFVGLYNFYGVVALSVCYVSVYSAIYLYETQKVKRVCDISPDEKNEELAFFRKNFFQYLKVGIALFIFLALLVGYIFAYAYTGTAGQKLLPFAMAIITFIIRKVILSLTDPFPFEISMFISAFWVENMFDMFQVMAYRSIKAPINYFFIWFVNTATVAANLFFLTHRWFRFRVWIKAALKRTFTCQPHKLHPPEAVIIEEDDPKDRGHSNNKPGYHRRQIRFYVWKVLSKLFACVFYISNSAVLRYGFNKEYYPFHWNTPQEYENSLGFAGGNFGFVLIAGILGIVYVWFAHRKLFYHVKETVKILLQDRKYIGLVIAIVTHNGILALSLLLRHNRIWYGFGHE